MKVIKVTYNSLVKKYNIHFPLEKPSRFFKKPPEEELRRFFELRFRA